MKYLLDANTYIQAMNTYYHVDFCPAYWDWLDMQFNRGELVSINMVYDELVSGQDILATWIKQRKNQFIAVDDELTQQTFSSIANYTAQNPYFKPFEIDRFLAGADPWLIAKAKTTGATLVTQEKSVGTNSTKVKIPNICQQFAVDHIDTFELLSRLKAKFVL
jgi:hypothetical protein